MSDQNKQVRIFTTASSLFDLKYTNCLDHNFGQTATGRTVRLVEIPEDKLKEQTSIYESNLESIMNESEWRFELQFGNVRAYEDVQLTA